MKKYSVFELEVVKVARGNDTYRYFICKHNELKDTYVEIFTKTKIKKERILSVESLSEYYSVLERCNYTTGKPLILPLTLLFSKYNEINYVNFCLDMDEETIETELKRRGLLEESKIYRKRNLRKKES